MNMFLQTRRKKTHGFDHSERDRQHTCVGAARSDAGCRTCDVRAVACASHPPALLDRSWTPAIDDLLTQQVREPGREIELRDTIPRLTAIEDEVSQRVRQQYEENPYPRWVHAAGQVAPLPIDQYLREQFPTALSRRSARPSARHPRRRLRDRPDRDCLRAKISGRTRARRRSQSEQSCPTPSAARRTTLAPHIEYAQADILKLASIERSFDVIDSAACCITWRIRLKAGESC